MALTQTEYEELREKVISKYKILYKDSMAMDMCEVPKEVRIRMFEDPYYISKTKAAKIFTELSEYSMDIYILSYFVLLSWYLR